MKKNEKIEYLFVNHFAEWHKVRAESEEKLSKQQPMFCVCGKLATGFHERNCRKFRDKVEALTVKELKHLLPKQTRKEKGSDDE